MSKIDKDLFTSSNKPLVGVIMGSINDADTAKYSLQKLKELKIDYEVFIISAHRTPDRMYEYAKMAEIRGIKIIIAMAGGAAHLPGMTASLTSLPVIGVPVKSKALNGIDSLLSISEMPSGTPVATMAIGKKGAENAAIFAGKILALSDAKITKNLTGYKEKLLKNTHKNPLDY